MRLPFDPGGDLTDAEWDLIAVIAECFEAAARREPPHLETYLSLADRPAVRRPLLLELIPIDAESRSSRGERADAEYYLSRFPGELGPDDAAELLAGPSPSGTAPLPHYEIIGEIGSGAMGVVYLARQTGLGRRVALKRLAVHGRASAVLRARFQAEATALGAVRHPHIVEVYDAGDSPDGPYIAMEYCDGGTLAARLEAPGRPDPRAVAAAVLGLADGLHTAHEHEILHRDVKPANILIDAAGACKLADFGLARRRDQAALTCRSALGVGTPAYMAPEQSHGEYSRASDVYGLGAVLYHWLTGRPPFLGQPAEVLRRCQEEPPVRPRKLNPAVPRDLEVVCLKCLEKDPRSRYETAAALASDLGRFLAGRPVQARPTGAARRAARWVGRNRVFSSLALAIVTFAGVAAYNWSAERQARQAAELAGYRLSVRDADRAWTDGRADLALDSLGRCPVSLRGWEWHYLRHRGGEADSLIAQYRAPVSAVAVSGNGTRVVSVGEDGWLRETDIASRTDVAVFRVCDGSPNSVGFDAGARRVAILASRGGQIGVWDISVRQQVRTLAIPPEGDGGTVSLSPDGSLLAHSPLVPAPRDTGVVSVWDVRTGLPRPGYRGHTADPPGPAGKPGRNVHSIAFSPDGRLVVSGTRSRWHVWEADTGKPVRSGTGGLHAPAGELQGASGLHFVGPTGEAVITGWRVDDRVGCNAELLFHGPDPQTRPTVLGAFRHTYAPLALSADGRLLACPTEPRVVTVRAADTGREVARSWVPGKVSSLAFPPEGGWLVIGGLDGSVRIAQLTTEPAHVSFRPPSTSRVFGLCAVDDGGTLACATVDSMRGGNAQLCVFDRPWEKPVRHIPLPGAALAPADLAASPSGSLIAVGMYDGHVQVWDWRRGERVAVLAGCAKAVRRVRFLSDDEVIGAGEDGRILSWNLHTPSTPKSLAQLPARAVGLAIFRPETVLAMSGYHDAGNVYIMRAGSGGIIQTLSTGTAAATAIAFGPGGKTLAVATDNPSTVQLWDWQAGRQLFRTEEAHELEIRFVDFSTDGTRLFTGSDDRSVKVWDARDGAMLLTLRGHTGAVNRGVVLPDGWLFTSSWDGTVRGWDGRLAP